MKKKYLLYLGAVGVFMLAFGALFLAYKNFPLEERMGELSEMSVVESESPEENEGEEEQWEDKRDSEQGSGEFFTLFSLNIHDWANSEESIATTKRVLEIHEKYGVPVDLYFTDPLFRMYLEKSPELIEEIRTSSIATAAYHIRPPLPYYSGFDWYGLATMPEEEIRKTVIEYETHALDLVTGKPTQEPGGYQYFVEKIGYALGVGTTGSGAVGRIVAEVYHDMGAVMMAGHGRQYDLGQKALGGLVYRPEHQEIKLYEWVKKETDGGAVIASYLEEVTKKDGAVFLGIKYHEDNFYYSGGTPWWPVFWTSQEKEEIRLPPYDVTQGSTGGFMQKNEQSAAEWELYESAVRYVAEHPEIITALNLRDVEEMMNAQ